MKKRNRVPKNSPFQEDGSIPKISPTEAAQFLEDLRVMRSQIDEPTVPISLRIPQNILRSLKLTAKQNGQKYQTLLIQLVREGLLKPKNKL